MKKDNWIFCSSLAKEKHGDSCGSKSLDETPQCKARGGSAAPTESAVFFLSGV